MDGFFFSDSLTCNNIFNVISNVTIGLCISLHQLLFNIILFGLLQLSTFLNVEK